MSSFKNLHLILNVTEANRIIENILNFFNLKTLNSRLNGESLTLLNELNFIKFASSVSTTTPVIEQGHQNLIHSPAYSIVLFSNANINTDLTHLQYNNEWKYHHKVELKDERDHVIARQVFFQQSPHLPLFCKSNIRQDSSTAPCDTNTNNTKFIIRLNLNCKNFPLMLIFYRLLFDKYPNYSKRNFSVFVLYQTPCLEFQLSLKYDENVRPYVLSNVHLMYFIESQKEFYHNINLLNGLVQEIVPNTLYLVSDPDGNQIYLCDASLSSRDYLNKKLFLTNRGFADVFFNEFYLGSNDYLYKNTDEQFSTTTSSSSCFSMFSTSSSNNEFDLHSGIMKSESLSSSEKDSGNWSTHSSRFNINKPKRKLNCKDMVNIGNTELDFSDLDLKGNNNQYYDFCYGKISAAKSLAQRKKFKSNGQQTQNSKHQPATVNVQHFKTKSQLNSPNDEYEGLLGRPVTTIGGIIRKAKSVSFVDKLVEYKINDPLITELKNFNRMRTKSQINIDHCIRTRPKSCVPQGYDECGSSYVRQRSQSPFTSSQSPFTSSQLLMNKFNSLRCSSQSVAIEANKGKKDGPVTIVKLKRKNANKIQTNLQNHPSAYLNSNNFNSISHNNYCNQNYSIDYIANTISLMKPFIGITPQTRSRKTHTLSMIRSTKMPLNEPPPQSTHVQDVLVLKDRHNNEFMIPVAKF